MWGEGAHLAGTVGGPALQRGESRRPFSVTGNRTLEVTQKETLVGPNIHVRAGVGLMVTRRTLHVPEERQMCRPPGLPRLILQWPPCHHVHLLVPLCQLRPGGPPASAEHSRARSMSAPWVSSQAHSGMWISSHLSGLRSQCPHPPLPFPR